MYSSSPARTPKSQLAAEQPSTGEFWIPPKKDTPHPRAKGKPQQIRRQGVIAFKIKSQTHQRCLNGTNKTFCAPGLRERSSDSHKRLSQACICLFDCLLWRHGSAVTCQGDRCSGCSRPGRPGVWHLFSSKRLPLAPV